MAFFDWNETNTATLKRLWNEGHSASVIAMRLGVPTRSAVIGKVHRLGINQERQPRCYPSRTIRVKKTPRLTKPRAVRFPIREVLPPLPETDTPKGPLVMFADLERHHCRASYGDPHKQDFGFCGCSVVPGTSYCEDHVRRYYRFTPDRTGRTVRVNRILTRFPAVTTSEREDVLA